MLGVSIVSHVGMGCLPKMDACQHWLGVGVV